VPAAEGLQRQLEDERERVASDGDGSDMRQRLEAATVAIEAGGAEIADWELTDGDFVLMRSGLERSYRRGRDRVEAVCADASDKAVHEWRKRVKDLWYHLRLLRGIWPEAMQGPVDAAHELSDLLGDHHDLSVLAQDVREDNGHDAHSKALLGLIERRQRELFAAALPLGERLYAEKPKQFAGRLSAYWDAWQGE
jgi:CHAD domain